MSMMKSVRHIFIFGAMILSAAILLSCSRHIDEGMGGDGKVRVCFRMPVSYNGFPATRAITDVLPETGADTVMRHLPDYLHPEYLPEGSTLWMTLSEYDEESGTYTNPQLHAYQVKSSGEWNSLYPCRKELKDSLDRDGNPVQYWTCITDGSAAPLYLDPGIYKFKLISPALPLVETNDNGVWNWKLHIDNGMYFSATDGRYYETKPVNTVVTIDPDGSNIQYVELNPIIQQTARFNFSIVKGNQVDSLMILPAGVEISGLQNPEKGYLFDWTSEDIRDTLVAKRGDKLQWLKMSPEKFSVSTEPLTWNSVTYNERLTGHIGVLPTDAMSTTIIITFNLLVNGIPTQYVTTMNQIKIQHGHEYHLKLKVDQKDGITVFTWQYQSWTHDLELNPA